MTLFTSARPHAGADPHPPAATRWSRIMRALAPGMASVAMLTGAPLGRTVWGHLITERTSRR